MQWPLTDTRPLGVFLATRLCTQAEHWVVHADSSKLNDVVLQGPEGSLRAGPAALDPSELGVPDVMLMGSGWSIPVHRCVPHWPLVKPTAMPAR